MPGNVAHEPPCVAEQGQGNDCYGQQDVGNQHTEIHHANGAFPTKFGGLGQQVKYDVTHEEQGRQRKCCCVQRAVSDDLAFSN